ncbi:MAG: hypothetical protein GWO81_03345 [Verrucomicrobia bacterium]|nr:hypothetical protein [Verrucomicrobiota bacterium]
MSEDTLDDLPEKTSESLDLNTLTSLDFGPSWAGDSPRKGSGNRHKNYEGGKRAGSGRRPDSGSVGRDRRPARSSGDGQGRSRASHASGGGSYGQRDGRKRRDGEGRSQIFEPTVKIDVYPQDEAFDALVKRLQSTARTYQLFEITKLLLEKYERFIVVVSPKAKSKNEGSKELFFSVPGHLPFETEDAALNYVLNHHIDSFFETETIEVEPPKGNFQMINRCPFTGALLGPPNYHRYQEFLQQHYANRVNGISLERYLEKIETVKDQEVIDAWVDSMKQSVRYTVKEPAEGEPTTLGTLEAARLFLLQHRKSSVLGSGESVRFAGRDLERLPAGDIRRSVESFVEQQRHFPLETANNLRGRLRRHNFTIYKKGAKNASFVCAVKRKFRDLNSVFTDSIQALIDFIEKNPEVKASELARVYLGIEAPKTKPAKLKLTETEAGAEEVKSTVAETSDTGATEQPVDEPEAPVTSDAEAESAESNESSQDSAPEAVLTEEQEVSFKQLRVDLRWLVTEGYVTEYGDGRLYAPTVLPPAKPKSKDVAEGGETAVPNEDSAKDSEVSSADEAASGSESEQVEQIAASSDDVIKEEVPEKPDALTPTIEASEQEPES